MSSQIDDSLRTGQQKDLDAKRDNDGSQYSSVAEVNASIPVSERCLGCTVFISGVEYWYRDGILDTDLIIKSNSVVSNNLPEDFYIAFRKNSTTIDYGVSETDTIKQLDLSAIAPELTITNVNALVRLKNNDFCICFNAYQSGVDTTFWMLYDCYLDENGDFNAGSYETLDLDIVGQTSLLYYEGSVFTLNDEVSNAKLVKFNPYNVSENEIFDLQNEPYFTGQTSNKPFNLKAYKNYLYFIVGAYGDGAYLCRVSTDFLISEALFKTELGNANRFHRKGDFEIYQDKIYVPTLYNVSSEPSINEDLGIVVFDLNGNFDKRIYNENIFASGTNNGKFPVSIWLTVFDGKVLIGFNNDFTSPTNSYLIRLNASDLSLEEKYALPFPLNNKQRIDFKGNIYISSESVNNPVYKFKYNDFSGTVEAIIPANASVSYSGILNTYSTNKNFEHKPKLTTGLNLPEQFFASVMSSYEGGDIVYETDSYRNLSIDSLVKDITIKNSNEILRDEQKPNNLFVISNSTDTTDETKPITITRLEDFKIVENELVPAKVTGQEFTVKQRTHGVKIQDGYIYICTRPETANLGTIPTQLFKINAYDFDDYDVVELDTVTYDDTITDIVVYGDYVYAIMAKFNGSSPREGLVIRFDKDDITNYSTIFDCVNGDHTRNLTGNTPFWIEDDKIYIPTIDTTSTVTQETYTGLHIFDLDGNLLDSVIDLNIGQVAGKYFYPHWIVKKDDYIIITPTAIPTVGRDIVIRIDLNTMTLDETLSGFANVSDDNSLLGDWLYLSEENEDWEASRLIKMKYDDFAGTFTVERTGHQSIGSIVPVQPQPAEPTGLQKVTDENNTTDNTIVSTASTVIDADWSSIEPDSYCYIDQDEGIIYGRFGDTIQIQTNGINTGASDNFFLSTSNGTIGVDDISGVYLSPNQGSGNIYIKNTSITGDINVEFQDGDGTVAYVENQEFTGTTTTNDLNVGGTLTVDSITSNTPSSTSAYTTAGGTATFNNIVLFRGLSGLNLSDDTPINSSDVVLTAFGKLQAQINNGSVSNTLSKTADYTILITDFGSNGSVEIYVDATSGAVEIELPTAVSMEGYSASIIKTDNSANSVTVKGEGTTNINQSNTYLLSTQNMNATIKSDGTQYWIF